MNARRLAPSSLVLVALVAVLACSKSPAPPENLDFPKGFLFGAAIAGFQADMGCPSAKAGCIDSGSDWYTWVTRPELIADSSTHLLGGPVTDGPGFYELYPQDLDRVKNELHHGAL